MPSRKGTENEKNIIKYMLNGDHCSQMTPVLEIISGIKDEEVDIYHQIIDHEIGHKKSSGNTKP